MPGGGQAALKCSQWRGRHRDHAVLAPCHSLHRVEGGTKGWSINGGRTNRAQVIVALATVASPPHRCTVPASRAPPCAAATPCTLWYRVCQGDDHDH